MTMKKDSNWKIMLNHWLFNFHKEVVKTGVIGKQLLTASRTNLLLKETYEELGRTLEEGAKNGELEWNTPKVKALLQTIQACKKDLAQIEQQVYKIKFSSSGPKCPQDISRQIPDYSSLRDEKKDEKNK